MLAEDEIDYSILAFIGNAIAWIFKPLGWGTWQAAVASITGLVAKENIVGTMGILYGGNGDVYGTLAQVFNVVTGYSFLVFNLLCAPCFAAIGAIKREMNNPKWTWFAIGYQCGFAYIIALMINQFGKLFMGQPSVVGLIFAVAALAGVEICAASGTRPVDHCSPCPLIASARSSSLAGISPRISCEMV